MIARLDHQSQAHEGRADQIAEAVAYERARCVEIARAYPFTDLGQSHSNAAVCINTATGIADMILGRISPAPSQGEGSR